MQKRTLLLLRFVLILSTILVMTYSERGLNITSPGYAVALAYFLSNLALYLIPETKFTVPLVSFAIFLTDLVAVSLAIYLSQGMQADFYLIFFLIIFIASFTQDIRGSIPIAIAASIVYTWLVYRLDPGASLMDSAILIKVPFLFIVSIISSYWASAMRRELMEKKKLETSARRLEDEVARITAEETELRRYSEMVINCVASGVIVVKDDGTITTVNPEAARVLGVDPGNLTGRNIKSTQGLEMLWQKMMQAMRSNRSIERLQISIRNADNEPVPIGLSVSPMHSPKTGLSGCVGVLRDLTEVRELERKLQHAERLSYLGKMATWVAHEIRNPLTAIDGFSQLLSHTRDLEKIEVFSKEIHRGTRRINHIIEDILTFARTKTQAGAADINLHQLMTEITEDIANVRVFIDGANNVMVRGEEESFKSLFTNIINNSIEAMDKDPKIVIKFSKTRQWIITEIADNGRGISSENMKNLLTPFFTTKSRGTGLGLAIVKKIVDDYEGKLELHSEEGKGTTCRVYLPKKEDR